MRSHFDDIKKSGSKSGHSIVFEGVMYKNWDREVIEGEVIETEVIEGGGY